MASGMFDDCWPSCLKKQRYGGSLLDDDVDGDSSSKDTKKEKKHEFKQDLKVIWKLLPYLWPKGRWDLRILVLISGICLVLTKVWILLVPIAYKNAIDDLSLDDPVFPWQWILFYAALKLLNSATKNFQDAFFVKVKLECVRHVALDTFEHLHKLSLRFHVHRKTGGVLAAFQRGTTGVSYLLQMMMFNVFPTILELTLTCGYLVIFYEIWFPLMILVVIVAYVVYTLTVTNWRNKFRRQLNDMDNQAQNKAVDSLINFETVKYFGNESHEAGRYNEAIDSKNQASVKSQVSLALLNVGQAACISIGSLSVMMLAAHRVMGGDISVGDFVLLNSYLLQLYVPLNFLGTSYRLIKNALIDLENMFELMEETEEIQDPHDMQEISVTEGRIVFDNVQFSYDEDVPVLRGVTFEVPPGHTVAIVGSTGAGKSTISRLLFRFYDIKGGSIVIDGQDVRDVTQQSLRQSIGVVPQDTVLFNDTLMYNLRYGRTDSTEEEIYRAAKLAQIHDFIMGLPMGYETQVGERGLRLSGGEKQRVSIARAILKNPPIMVFDEATSALDTATEKEIQSSLRAVSEGKSTLIIAHRLSTIVDADEIIVLQRGVIAERGRHDELIDLQGEYYNMWMKQQETEEMAAERNLMRAEEEDGGDDDKAKDALISL